MPSVPVSLGVQKRVRIRQFREQDYLGVIDDLLFPRQSNRSEEPEPVGVSSPWRMPAGEIPRECLQVCQNSWQLYLRLPHSLGRYYCCLLF